MSKQSKIFLSIALLTFVIIGIALQYYLTLHYAILYILAINIVTVIFYFYDKIISRTQKGRVPEIVLHILTLIGGSLGALLATILLRHKSSKQQFMLVTWAILLAQAMTIGFLTYKDLIF